MCKIYHKLEVNPQVPDLDDLIVGRANPEEAYVLPEHDYKGISCHGSGIIPDILEHMDPELPQRRIHTKV